LIGSARNEKSLFSLVLACSAFSSASPFNNPTETYRYYSLPFCHEHSTEEEEKEAAQEDNLDLPEIEKQKRLGALRHKQRLGESIVGDRRETSPYEVSFGDSVEWRLLCKTSLTPEDLVAFKDAIHNNYFFEMFIEDLPMWGYIGDTEDEDLLVGEGKTFLFPHLHFIIGHNDKQIVSAKITTDVSQHCAASNVFINNFFSCSSRRNSPCFLADGSKGRYFRR
jgi:Endomembrane protein 70